MFLKRISTSRYFDEGVINKRLPQQKSFEAKLNKKLNFCAVKNDTDIMTYEGTAILYTKLHSHVN